MIFKRRPRRCPRCGHQTMNLRRTAAYVNVRWAICCRNLNCNYVATSKSSFKVINGG